MNKKSSVLSEFKQFCIDKLWFVVLLAPLLIIALMMFKQFQPSENSRRVNNGLAVVGPVEISTAELASIVAKPLTELIAMEVYSVVNNTAAIAGPIRKSELRQVSYNHLSEIRRAEDNPTRVISYAVTEKTTTKIIREAS